MHDSHTAEMTENVEPPVSIRHIFRVLRAYAGVILIAAGSVALAAVILTLGWYLMTPGVQVATLPFQLEFEGASEGKYPNQLKFNPNDIITTPILSKVYEQNSLKRFTSFSDFTHSIFVLEHNAAYERLVAEYQARLSDPRLLTVERQRIEKEFDEKSASLAKNQYSLNFALSASTATIPSTIASKTLGDILPVWARHAMETQGVLRYDIGIISPDFVSQIKIDAADPLVSVLLLRARIAQTLADLDQLQSFPGINLVRSPRSHQSLHEIRLRVEDLLRFDVEPLVTMVIDGSPKSAASIRLIETQLAYEERQLNSSQQRVEATRQTLLSYAMSTGGAPAEVEPNRTGGPAATSGEASVVPQLTDSFIDRIVQLTSGATDQHFRQKLAEDFRDETMATIPLRSSVDYHRRVLTEVRAPGGSASVPAEVRTRLERTRSELARLVTDMNEIYVAASHNLNPSAQLYTASAPISVKTDRRVSIVRLAMYCFLAVLLSLPIIIVACFVHNRARQEDAADVVSTAAA